MRFLPPYRQVAFTFGIIGTCKLFFDQIVPQFEELYPHLPPHGRTQKNWRGMFEARWSNARKHGQQVYAPVARL
jgi:hypothetical protein